MKKNIILIIIVLLLCIFIYWTAFLFGTNYTIKKIQVENVINNGEYGLVNINIDGEIYSYYYEMEE